MYYTFREIQPFLVEVTKWEDNRAYPLDTYTVSWRKNMSANCCDCPARVPCRHLKMVDEFINGEYRIDPHLWIFSDKWERVYDQDVCIYRELIEV